MNNKVVIVGTGNVGMAYAYATLNQKTKVDELVLIDKDTKKTIGNAMDLNHAAVFAPSKITIKAGSYSDCRDASIVVIAAGANQEKGESRLDLINKNKEVFKEVVSEIVSSGFNGIFLIATNPVDIMTYITRKYSHFPSNKVIGSGTVLDSARLKYLLSTKIGINSKNIHAYVIGEHGDSEFVLYSSAEAGVVKINKLINTTDLDIIENEVRNSAYKIIEYKGATCYGIGNALVRIVNSILSNEGSILTVSSPIDDIYIGMPSVINKDGIKGVMRVNMTEEELKKFENSKNILKNIINNMED